MNRTHLKGLVCASALAMAASAAFAQDQEPITPATPAVGATTTARLTPDASTSVMVKVDGSRVIDATGQPLGRIENIVLSPVGCAEAAILTSANGRLVPIPWSLVRVSGDTRVAGAMPGANLVFTVGIDQARLASAPSFTRSQWPDMSSQVWLQPTTAFFATGSTNAVGATGAGGTTITGGATNQIRIPNPANTTGPNSGALPPTGRPNQSLPDFQPSTPPPAQAIPPAPTTPPPQTPNNRPSGVQPTPAPGAAGSAPPPAPRPATQP